MPGRRRIYVGLGGNVGQVPEAMRRALHLLEERGMQPLALSRLYQTAPVGGIVQADYLNAVAALETIATPTEVLGHLLAVEADLGRNRAQEERWGPRTLDLDYLLDEAWPSFESTVLTLPHPRLWERAFVVIPLADVWPTCPAPDSRAITAWASEMRGAGGVTEVGQLTEMP